MKTTNRISLDYDHKWLDLYSIGFSFIYLSLFHKWKQVTIYKSPSGKGWHVIFQLVNQISLKKQLEIRKMLGDCAYRLKYSKKDLKNGYNSDVLFTHKKVDGKWIKEEKVLDFKVSR